MNRYKVAIIVFSFAVILASLHTVLRLQRDGAARATAGEPLSPAQYVGVNPTEDQNAMLADGVVTEDELLRALDNAADCLVANGVEPMRPGDPQLEGHLLFGYVVRDEADRVRARGVARRCDFQHAAYVTAAYRRQTRGSDPSNPVLGPDGKPVDPALR